ncbi:MAG: flagellar filament capping protein FliD [Desulfobulbaceae bacterium]|nr:flagellar filament capping protein FliD [Desulfobulbaceae bacterium]
MAEVTFGGLATGLPTEDIITKLMAIERRPLDNLEADKTYETTRLKAYGQLNTRLNELREAAAAMNLTSEVRTTKARLSSESAFTATTNNAIPGSYNIVVKQLAQVQKDVSAVGYASSSTSIFGTGSITVNGKAISINADNNSLQGLSAAINAAAEETGVSASIINDGKGAYHLVLTGKDAAATEFKVEGSLKNGDGVVIPFATTTTQHSKMAELSVDGISVSSNSNTITGVIAGVTLNLNATSPIPNPAQPTVYTATKMDIVADPSALKEKISTFVASYNKVIEWMTAAYEDKTATDTTTTDSTTTETDTTEDILSDYLRGDATVNSIKRGLQSILTDTVKGSGSLHVLSEIGISTDKDGTLVVNNSKLDTALENGLDGMTKLLAGEEGVAGVMQKFNTYLLDATSATKGMYADKRDRYESRVERMDKQIADKTTMLDKIEARLKARFNAMELLISNLNSQSGYLTQLSNLNNSGNN